MNRVARYRLAGLVGVALLASGGEWYFSRVTNDHAVSEALLILGLVALVVVDQLIVTLIGTHPEEILASIEDLKRQVTQPDADSQFLQKWNSATLREMVSRVTAGGDRRAHLEGDVRVLTTFFIDFTSFIPEVKRLLLQGVRFQICLLNPDNEALLYGRFAVRKDGRTPEVARQEILTQIRVLSELPGQLEGCTGSIEVKVVDLMPCGFVFHTRQWIVYGIMPAEWSYEVGPMIRVSPETETGKVLTEDWRARWSEARTYRPTALARQGVQSSAA